MANEFKIKKGLIVTGASGGTVVDIQGSQGQLFSVTDDLSGSIFAVSDISGVPILDVNSSGVSYFDGKLGIGTANPSRQLEVVSSSGIVTVLTSTTGGSYISMEDSATTSDSQVRFGAIGNNAIIKSGGATALTLSASQNAAFAAKVQAASWFQGNGATNTLYSNVTAGVLLQTAGSTEDNNDSKIFFRNSGTTVKHTFDTYNGDATFVGQGFSSATSSGDGSSTLTTKGYVDGLITGATIYRGAWDPSGGGYGSPDLSGVTQTSGYYYICSADGTAEPNGTGTEPDTWAVGDWVIYNDVSGTGQWQKIDNSSVLSGVGTGQTVALWEGAGSVTDSETLGNAPITVSGNNTTFAGSIDSGNIVITNSGVPALTITDDGNAGGGGASGKIIYANIDGNAMGLGYTADVTTSSDFIISSDAGSTYGGYLGLAAGAIDDPSSIILDPKTYVYATKALGIGTNTPNDLLAVHNTATGAVDAQMNFTTADTGQGGSDGFRVGWNGAVAQMYLFEDADMRFATNNSEKMTITSAGGISFGSTGTAYGTAGQILKSNADASPTWVNASTVIGGPYLPLTAGSSYPLTGGLYIPSYIYHTGDTNTLFGFGGQDLFIINTGGGRRLTVTNTEATFENNLIVENSVKADAFFSHQGTYTSNTYVNDWQKVYSHNWSTFSFSAFTIKVLAGGDTSNNNLNADVHINYKMQNGAYRVYANIVNYGSEALLAENFKINLSVTSAASGSWTIWHKLITNYQTPYYTLIGSGIAGTWYSETPVASPTGDDDTWNERIILNSMSVDVDNSGNVGIGTTSPGAKLHVDDSVGGVLRLSDTLATSDGEKIGGIETGVANGTFFAGINFFRHDENDGEIRFRTKVNNTNTDVATIVDGNVGIGTTTPLAKLDIQGTQGQLFSVTDDLSGSIFAVADISGVPIFDVNSSGVSYFDGNVGIGTTSPGAKLEVVSARGAEGIHLNDGSFPTVGKVMLDVDANGDGEIRLRNSNSTLTSVISGGEDSYLLGGNVGIGITGPQQKLHIVDTDGANIILNSNTGAENNGIWMTEGGVATPYANGAYVHYDSTNNAFKINTGTTSLTTKLAILRDSGNVGIGTTTPDNILHVRAGDTGYASQVGADTMLILETTNVSNSLQFSSTTSGNQYIMFGDDDPNAGWIAYAHSDNSLNFRTNGSERMRIDSSGNVGIGTTSPDARFDVADRVEIDTYAAQATGNNAFISGYLRIIAGAKTGWGVDDELGKIEFYGEDTSGAGARTAASIIAVCEGGNGTSTTTFSSGLALYTSPYNAAQEERIRISATGNVGIGTTNPNAKLNVDGGIKIEGTNSLSFGGTAAIPAWGINSSGNDLIINDQATTVGDVLFTNARNVGIGVTSADAKLEVAQNAGGAGLNVINGGETAFRLSTRVEDTTVNTVVFRQGIYHNNTENATIAFYRGGSSVGGFMTFQTQNGNERMRINANGNVGINITNPQAKLDIVSANLGGAINNTSTQAIFGVSNANYSNLYIQDYRTTAGTDWTSSGKRIQMRIDTTYMGYMQFNGTGNNGGISFGTGTSTTQANVTEKIKILSSGATTFTSTVTATNFILSSDERLKENIEKACDNRIKADWKTFELKTDKGQKRYGVIAQELEKTNPEFVREDTQGFKSVAYIDLLIAKIAELEARLEKAGI